MIVIKAVTLIYISGRGLAVSSVKERKSCFIFVFVILFEPFMKLVTVYTLNTHLLTLKAPIRTSHPIFVVCINVFQPFLKKSVGPDQTAPASSLIWGLHRLHIHLRDSINNISRFKYYGCVMGQDDAVTCNCTSFSAFYLCLRQTSPN